jgi:hypothetical protein
MEIFSFIRKSVLRSVALATAIIMSAACTDLHENYFHISSYPPEINRSENTILTDTPNERRVFVLFSFGYNNLSYDLKEDIEDMIAAGVPEYGFEENVVLVLSQNTSKGYNYNTPSAPVLTHIYTRGDNIIRDTLKVYADTAVAARKAIVHDVLSIAKERYPAKNYGMLLSSHGTGWAPQGYCYSPPDKSYSTIWGLNSGSYDGPAKYHEERPLLKSIGSHYAGSAARSIEIEIPDLADAIPMHMDYILFDACFMGCIEVAYELKDKCDRICFSQTEILSNGMDYRNLLSVLFSEEAPDIEKCAENYFNMYKDQSSSVMRSATISVVDCRRLDGLAEVVAKHSDAINTLSVTPSSKNKVQGYFQPRYSRYHGIFFDLESAIKESGATADELEELSSALEDCVVCKYATASFLGEFAIKTHSGLSMYIPDSDRYILNEYYKKLQWNKATNIVR